ncbi:hypothetical protein ACJX0J_029832 [Zea mays]
MFIGYMKMTGRMVTSCRLVTTLGHAIGLPGELNKENLTERLKLALHCRGRMKKKRTEKSIAIESTLKATNKLFCGSPRVLHNNLPYLKDSAFALLMGWGR